MTPTNTRGFGSDVNEDAQETGQEAVTYTTSYRVTAAFYALAAAGVAPFVVYHAVLGNTLLFVLILATVAALAGGAAYTMARHTPGHSGKVIAAIAAVAILATINDLGAAAVYWVFPFTLINYYVFPLRWGLLINGLFLAAFFPLVYDLIPTDHLYRVATSVLLTNLMAVVFSHAVRRKQAELSRLATRDPLTGLGNRRSLDQALAQCVERFHRGQRPATVAVLDLDHFKHVNDTRGHHLGDEVLITLADCLGRRLRKTDGLYRFGGEEFVAVLTDTDLEEGIQVAEELRRRVADCDLPDAVRLTMSAGVAGLGLTDEADTWLARADNALYRAKSRGRDRLEVGTTPDRAEHGGTGDRRSPTAP